MWVGQDAQFLLLPTMSRRAAGKAYSSCVANGSTPGIVGVIRGDPQHPHTWSGISRYMFGALSKRGALEGAVDAQPPRPLQRLAMVSSFSPNLDRWRQRYNVSTLDRRAMTWFAARRATRVDARPDALLQVGAWCDLSRSRQLRPKLRCSYHDGNLAVVLRRLDVRLESKSKRVKKVLDFERRVFDSMDLIMPMSEWLRSSFVEDFEQDPTKVVVVGAGANLESIPPPPSRRFHPPRLLFVGRDFTRKGGPQLLAAFARVRAQAPEAALWVVGPEEGLDDAPGVRFWGPISKDRADGKALMERLYEQATAFVMPSRFEPFGIAFLEAMAYRLPCIGADRCAMPEIIEQGVTGFRVAPEDPDELADHLLFLIAHPDRAAEMGEAGYRRFLERYTWDQVAKRMVSEISKRIGVSEARRDQVEARR